MAGGSIILKSTRPESAQALPRLGLRVVAAFMLEVLPLVAAFLAFPPAVAAAPDPIKGEVSITTGGGYTRLVFRFAEEPEAEVRLTNGIIVIAFKRPVDVSVDRLSTVASEYIGAARRDPDGSAIRLALVRKVTVNSMTAGEQLFVDLLPEGWTGLPPGLPQEVVEDLARRAREAEKKFRQQQQLAKQQQSPLLRVRVGTQPTFTRYVFELPELVQVTSDRTRDGLTLVFDAPWRFDLADAQAVSPPVVSSIKTSTEDDTVSVHFEFAAKVDVRTFREDNNFVVDVSSASTKDQARAKRDLPAIIAAVEDAGVAPPVTIETAPPAAPTTAPTVAPDALPAASPLAGAVPMPLPRPASAPKRKLSRARQVAPPPMPALPPAPPSAERDQASPPPAPAPRQLVPPPPGSSKGDGEKAEAPPALASTPAAEIAGRPGDRPALNTAGAVSANARTSAESADGAPVAPAVGPPDQAVLTRAPPQAGAPAPPPPAKPSTVQASQGPEDSVIVSPNDPNAPVVVVVRQQSDALRLVFPFAAPTSAAVFRRADTLWLVFDTAAPVDISKLIMQPLAPVRSATVSRSRDGQVVRIKLDRPKLASLSADGSTWTVTIGDMVLGPTQPLVISRSVIAAGRISAVIPLDAPQELHRLSDPDVGDTLLVVTAFGPARGFVKGQNFVEFRALASTHGIALQPLADDLSVDLVPDKVVIGRTSGLTLSGAGYRVATLVESGVATTDAYRPFAFDAQLWGYDQHADFQTRQADLMRAAAAAPERRRLAPRLDLARFYLARNMFYEAKAVLDVTVADGDAATDDPSALVLRAVANIMIGRGAAALKDLANPAVGNQQDAGLWRAMALARQGKWAEARAGFGSLEAATAMLPLELKRLVLEEAFRTALEVGDLADAGNQLHEFETLGVPPTLEPTMNVLKGRLSEGLGRVGEALASYRAAAQSLDRRAAAQGALREIVLRLAMGDLKRADAIPGLETLTMMWRGDDTEAEALQLLGRMYTEEARYRDAFHVMRTALAVHPGSEMTRRLQDEAAASFDVLFLSGKADAMPPIEALSLFYDYRELTPIGRRGDEMIRRLADRLVSIDLLDQAAALLQHQIDHRLQGAARAQVAIRLAVIYLMAHKPERALEALRATRTADLPNEIRNQRLLIEARALSDTGRYELAIDVVSNIKGREAERLRADVLWAARRWREAAEQIERLYGERWRDFAPLTELERADILRAGIGYALADETLGLDRFRQKYAAKMAEGPDRRAFDVVTSPLGTGATEFTEIAQTVSAIDTLDGFLHDLRARYPDSGAVSPPTPAVKPPTQSGAPTEPKPS